jgi:dihydroorotate dehydrogenase
MKFLWRCFSRVIFRLDAELVHDFSVFILSLWKFFLRKQGSKRSSAIGSRDLSRRVWDKLFLSPVGLAAGFDKNAKILPVLPKLGFGFAEIGTVTPRPQRGNPKPRLFRISRDQKIFNRMGFNNDGAVKVAGRIKKALPYLPESFRVGINIGKNKETSLEGAAEDYLEAVKPFRGLVDYVVINISSPNTPGLRALQSVENVGPIIDSVKTEVSQWDFPPPVFLKLAPEVRGDDLRSILSFGERVGISGWVLTNTLGGEFQLETGGWSGSVLTTLSSEVLVEARSYTQLPIISVGGILTPNDAVDRFSHGASLVQIYSGWIFSGPSLPFEIQKEILKEA